MSYAFDKNAKDGDEVTLENGATYKYEEGKDRWLVQSVDGKDNSVFEKHLFQLRGGFTLTGDRKVVVPIENPKNSQKGTRDYYDDLEYADYPGVFHLSEYDQYRLDDEQYTPELVEYFLFHGRGAFKENDGQGGWETAAHHNVKPNIAVGDIVTVRVTEGWRRDESDKYSTGFLGKVQHRWRVTEIIPCIEEDGSTPLNDGEWQCVKVEKCEREDLYESAEVMYFDRGFGLCDVTVEQPIESGSDSELNKDWMMQLRGNFEFDGDGKAVMPPKSYSNTEDDPVLNPETGIYESGWQKPGVYWYGAEPYQPHSITHLLVSKAVGFAGAIVEGDGAYIGYEEYFFQDWKVGDLIEVKSHEYGLYEADYYGKLLQQKNGGFHNNTWRVVEEVDVVNPDGDWPTENYSCFRVEKVAPPQFYQGSFEVHEDASVDGVSIAGFFPCEVTMNPAATQEDVDRLQSEIIELEEEIDAIAPSVERGVWTFNLGGVVGNRGQLTMYDGMNGTGSPIGLFKSVRSVWLNEIDNDGTPHGFANVNVGDLIELFVQGESDYGLFTVVEVHDESQGAAQYWVIDVEFVRSLSDASKADNADNVRVKIIQPPSAEGESDSRYLLNGDATDLIGVTRIVADSNKYLSIQSAPNNTQGFFVLRNNGGHNIMHVSDSGRILLKAGHLPKEIDEVTTKRYVDSKVGRAAPTIGRRFVFNRDAGEAIYPGWFGYDGDRFHFCKTDMDSQILVMNGPDFSWSSNIKFTIRDAETGEFVVMGEAHPRTDWNYAVLKLRVPQSVQTDGSGIRYGSISDLVHEKHYNIVVEGYF